jgi:hypothetical protein
MWKEASHWLHLPAQRRQTSSHPHVLALIEAAVQEAQGRQTIGSMSQDHVWLVLQEYKGAQHIVVAQHILMLNAKTSLSRTAMWLVDATR